MGLLRQLASVRSPATSWSAISAPWPAAINAFDPNTGVFEGTIPIDVGSGNTAGGLWALMFGNGGNGGDPNTLYFTDGIDGETHGLFGAIQTPLPGALPLFATGLGAFGLLGWRRKKKAAA